MAYRIFWTPIAVQDLRDICDFISRDNLVAAQRMGEELIKQSEAMAVFPLSGRMAPEKKDPLIRETLGSYRIIYRVAAARTADVSMASEAGIARYRESTFGP
jgi:plasmid stabilization system protein ParE